MSLGGIGMTAGLLEHVLEGVGVADRAKVQAALRDAGIPTAIHYPMPLNRQPASRDDAAHLPEGDAAAEEVISLPMHPYLGENDQAAIVDALAVAIGK